MYKFPLKNRELSAAEKVAVKLPGKYEPVLWSRKELEVDEFAFKRAYEGMIDKHSRSKPEGS